MSRYYLPCPHCRTRMRRTGKKIVEYLNPNGEDFYYREYECPSCKAVITYSESHRMMCYGSLEE